MGVTGRVVRWSRRWWMEAGGGVVVYGVAGRRWSGGWGRVNAGQRVFLFIKDWAWSGLGLV